MKKSIKYGVIILCLVLITGCNEKKDYKDLTYGKLIDFKESCLNYDENNNCNNLVAIIKAEIKDSYSNKATIDQNYYNISNFVKNNDISKYNEIQYWAINNNTQEKIISFNLNKELINKIKNNEIVDNQLGNYVNELYISPNLK